MATLKEEYEQRKLRSSSQEPLSLNDRWLRLLERLIPLMLTVLIPVAACAQSIRCSGVKLEAERADIALGHRVGR
jgi:hypothetical protein